MTKKDYEWAAHNAIGLDYLEATFQIIDGHWIVLSALPEEAVVPVLDNLSRQYGIPVEPLRAAFLEKRKIEGGQTD